jgi:hypothetical protein
MEIHCSNPLLSVSIGTAADLFTGVLPNCYMPPDGFCFDILCGDDPIVVIIHNLSFVLFCMDLQAQRLIFLLACCKMAMGLLLVVSALTFTVGTHPLW